MISIIIPVYNGKKYINDAIDSCLKQTYQNIEIIVIDDGSTDGLQKKDIESKSKKIKYLKKKNEGPGIARNLGMKISTGSYIFFLDADDTIEPKSMETLKQNIHNYDFIVGKSRRVFVNTKNKIYKSEIWKKSIYEKPINKCKLITDIISTNKLYKKVFLLKNKIDFEKGEYEDLLFVTKVYTHTANYSVCNEVIYNWYVRDNITSRSTLFTINTLTARIHAVEKCIRYVKDEKLKKCIIENIIQHDLKMYVNRSYQYNIKELKQLYKIYNSFVKEYKTYIDSISFKVNQKIINNIVHQYATINQFLKISYKKNNISNKEKHHRFRDIIIKILLKLENIGI